MILLSTLSVIITGTTFSKVVTVSESTHLAMQVVDPGWALPSWFKINKQGVTIRMPWYTFKKKISQGDVYSRLKSTCKALSS